MINKKKTLGKQPEVLGEKDAVHVPIVSVRAAQWLDPGTSVKINDDGEAVKSDVNNRVGVVDPFLTERLYAGDHFWLVVDPQKISSVSHTWDHPKVEFKAPTSDVKKNSCLLNYANTFGVTYEQLMEALQNAYDENSPLKYPGTLVSDDLETLIDRADSYDLWYEWVLETGNEFENIGSECCPEYEYPSLYRDLWSY